jgi:hypothetical protein
MTNTQKNIMTVGEKEGKRVSVAGNTYRIIMSGKQTDGSYAIIDVLKSLFQGCRMYLRCIPSFLTASDVAYVLNSWINYQSFV